jgi:long-chain acyl-CoA synthetase
MPAIADRAVFGIRDPEPAKPSPPLATARWRAHERRAFQTFLRQRIANYKVPRVVREESGKIFKRLLREPYWSAAGRRM